MKFTVRVFLGKEQIEESRLKDIVINSPVVNRIVDAAVDSTYDITEDRDPEGGNRCGKKEEVCQ